MEDKIYAEVEPVILVWARERLSATQDVVAKKTNISQNSIAGFESGEKQPTFEQLRKLSAFYRMNVSVFFLSEPPTKNDYIKASLRRIAKSSNADFSLELRREIITILTKRETFLNSYALIKQFNSLL